MICIKICDNFWILLNVQEMQLFSQAAYCIKKISAVKKPKWKQLKFYKSNRQITFLCNLCVLPSSRSKGAKHVITDKTWLQLVNFDK